MDRIPQENIVPMLDAKYIRLFDLQYAPGKHYFDASRNEKENLIASMTDEEFRAQIASAVTCAVICKDEDGITKLLLTYEYRYPVGRFLLSPPAGLIDKEDRLAGEDAVFIAAKREIQEETGIVFEAGDEIKWINPVLFSSPGFTDESNAMVCIVKDGFREEMLSQDGAVGTECFNGFKLLTKPEALQVLKEGRDEFGNFYSVYTWIALMYFVSDMWQA